MLAVRVAPAQERFVGTVAGALALAGEIPESKPWYRAIYADYHPVGFVMLSWNVTPQPPRIIGPWFLWKLRDSNIAGTAERQSGLLLTSSAPTELPSC